MDLNFSSLDVPGYQDQPILNTFITQPNTSHHLGIILPGYRYSPDMPPLHYAGRILLEQGADVLRIESTYYRTDFSRQPEKEQDEWLRTDVFAACDAGLAHRSYDKITLVGKSLGTLAMAHLLADRRFQNAVCIWLTPLFTVEWLRTRIEQTHPRSLFVVGTADPFNNPAHLKHLEHSTNGLSLVIEDANHALEIPGDLSKSLVALQEIVQALQEFMSGI